MNKKKVLIGLGLVLLISALAGAGIWAWRNNGSSSVVDVYPVEYLNSDDMYEYGTELTGVIVSDYVQEVVPDGTKEIKKIYVEVGDQVKEGDKLLKYNVDEQELDLKLQKLQIDASKLQIENMEKELEKLRNTKPVKGAAGDGSSLLLASLSTSSMENATARMLLAKSGDKSSSKKKTDSKSDSSKKDKKKKNSKKTDSKDKKKKDSKKKSSKKKDSKDKDSKVKDTKAKALESSAAEEGEEESEGSEDELAKKKIEEKQKIVEDKNTWQSYYEYKKDQQLADAVVTDYCGADPSVAEGGKIGDVTEEEGTAKVDELSQAARSELAKIAGYRDKRKEAIKQIDTYLSDKKYGKTDEVQKDKIYEDYCGENGKILTAADETTISKATDECLAKLKALDGGPLYHFIDDAQNQQSANSGNGSSEQTPIRYLLVRKDGKEPTIAGSVVNQFFADINYTGRYIDFRVYTKKEDYPEGTPELTYMLTPDAELSGTINFDKNYTVPEIQKLVAQKDNPDVEYLLKKVTKYTQYQAGKGTSKSKYKYYLKLNAPITGSVIKKLIKKKKYAVFQDYKSEDAFAAGADPKNTITITPSTLFSKSISSSKKYTIKDLKKLLVVVDSIKVTPQSKGLKKVVTGNSYQFNATLKGKNTSALTVVWSLKNAKSNSTRVSSGGLLTVGSDEKASALKVTASAGGKSGSYLVTVKKGSSSSSSSSSSTSRISTGSGSDDEINTYTADELKEAIDEKEQEIAEAKQELNEARIAYREEKKEVDAATVHATIDGKVTVATMDAAIDAPAVVVRGDDGMYVKTAVSELDFETVKVGGTIDVTSNETGEVYEATVREVSEFPVDGAGAEFGGNPNSSYYPIMAYISEAEELKIGERVTINYDSELMGTSTEKSIYLPMAYVRTEGKQAYVYKAGKDGRLVKANVKTGKVIQGQVIEVISGLSMDDAVAFPYGKNLKEGMKTKVSEDTENIIF